MKSHSGFKAGFCRAPGFSRISAVQQWLFVWNHLQNECHELWLCSDLVGHPRGANLCSYPGLETAGFLPLGHHSTAPWKALLLRGVSLAHHGCGVPHAAGEGNAIILPYSHPRMAVSPQSSSVTDTTPWLSLLQSSRLLHWNNNSRAHLRLIVQGCSFGRNKDVGNYSWKNPS